MVVKYNNNSTSNHNNDGSTNRKFKLEFDF